MLVILLPILFVAAVFHYMYQALIAPTLMDWIKYKMLLLKDELQSLRQISWKDERAFGIVSNSIESAIRERYSFTIVTLYEAWALQRSKNRLRVLVNEQDHFIEESPISQLGKITVRLDDCLMRLVLINSGGFFFWTWPFFLIAWVVVKVQRIDLGRIKFLFRSVLFVPKQEWLPVR